MNRTVKLISLLTVTGLIGFAGLKFIPQSHASNSLGTSATFESDFDYQPIHQYSRPTTLISKGSKINVRSGPGTNYAVNYVVKDNAFVTLHNEEIGRDGYRWYFLSFDDYAFSGWVREDLIASPHGDDGTAYKAEKYGRPLPEQLVVLDSKYSNSRINVRSGPGTNYRIKHYGLNGDQVEIFDISDGNDGYSWYHLGFVESGAEGWVREDLLAFIED